MEIDRPSLLWKVSACATVGRLVTKRQDYHPLALLSLSNPGRQYIHLCTGQTAHGPINLHQSEIYTNERICGVSTTGTITARGRQRIHSRRSGRPQY